MPQSEKLSEQTYCRGVTMRGLKSKTSDSARRALASRGKKNREIAEAKQAIQKKRQGSKPGPDKRNPQAEDEARGKRTGRSAHRFKQRSPGDRESQGSKHRQQMLSQISATSKISTARR
jgi:hypothetical protein